MRQIIYTKETPEPIGPYSQAVLAGNTLYCSGQIALDPHTGELKTANIEEETTQVMRNLEAVLKAAGCTFENVLKCSIFLANMDDFPKVNEVYARYFPKNPPARETVAVRTLPKQVNVEISLIAVK